MFVEDTSFGSVRLVLQDKECLALATALEAVLVCDGVPEFQEPPDWNAHLETVAGLLKFAGQAARDNFLGLDIRRNIAEGWERGVDWLEEEAARIAAR